MKRILLLLALTSYWLYALPAGIESAIKRSGLPKKDLSIYIKEAGESRRVVASLNASLTRTPASVIKVLTTYAAVLKLGFDYRWPTQFYRHGTLKNGVLHGDLIVKGFGDPTLNADDLDDIVAQIKAAGIRKITGNIIIDRSYFRVGTKNSSRFDENPYSPYNAMPDAMMFNERVSTICVAPNQNSVSKKYPDSSFVIHNQLQRVNKPCRGRYSWPLVKIDDSKAVPEVWLKGKISKRCGNRNICKVITKPYLSFYYALKDALHSAGVEVRGNMRLRKVPSDARILFTHYSKPLEKIVSKTAKKSNNLYARHLLLFLGAKEYGAPATLDKGRHAVVKILREHGALASGTLHIDNGSGLSRRAKLNAKMLASVLDNAYERYGMRWMKTLSIAGVDGTIKKRFRGTVVRNRAWMKTGTLKRVKNIAGYVKSRNGRYYTAVILVNTRQGRWKAAKLQNEIIQWLVNYKGRGIQKPKRAPDEPRFQHTETKACFIQADSFSHQPQNAYMARIKDMGYAYRVEAESDAYRVLIGPYESEAAAREALPRVRDQVNSGAFLVCP
ncbi:MAG: D-alanyl-D-alanine carboxypeptidase/D-alanyl-D-alanine-endopeptidase [Sulfurovum sp.]|nr:D-alanyl-D-alanine carboxypeptidase/D-alanyl-D-alanine-endopeptidase [Sulfurovum sp.]